MKKRLESFGDDREAVRAFGLESVTNLCQRLLDNGAPGLHFYTMNQAAPTLAILDQLQINSQCK
jgi:methylenetetrahydrofolate reductase (NADPH)